VLGANDEAHRLRSGEKHRDNLFWIPLPFPWSGEVAEVSWARSSEPHPLPLPSCVLYLGAANGVTVLYDHAQHRTWRVPSSDLIVRGAPAANKCPLKPGQ
jgi:hypothetical protein